MPLSNPETFEFADIAEGQTAEFEVTLSEELVARFAALSGDTNPLHMDESYAEGTRFGGRIAHGMLGGSFFSQLVGMHLPGRYGVYLSQNLRFKLPMRIGMKVVVRGAVVQKVEALRVIKLETKLLDAGTGECLVDGEAMVNLLQ